MLTTLSAHAVSLLLLSSAVYIIPSCALGFLIKSSAFCSFLFVSYLFATFVDNALPRFRVSAANKAVFITGCDSGFGLQLARRLDSIGFKVFAGCLLEKSEGTEVLKETTSNNLQIIQVDVTKDDSVQNALAVVENNLGNNELWAVVNNAGVIERGELEWMSMECYQQQFEVNTFGVVRITQAFLPLIRKSKGRVVTTTSTGGRLTFSGFVPYCMSKHATSSFCDGLRLEMAKFGVKVVTIEPISYRTNMTEMTTVLQSVENNWNKAPDHLKKDVYDSEYIEVFTESMRKFNSVTCRGDVHQVVDWMVDAVAAISPQYSYVPGDSTSLLNLWFVKRLPTTLTNYFIRKTVTFDCDVEHYLKENVTNKNK